jgi:hypothetical protein
MSGWDPLHMPRENLRPVPRTGLDRLPTRWRSRVYLAGIMVGLAAAEWGLATLAILTAQALGH